MSYFKYNNPLLENTVDGLALTDDDPIYQFCEECINSYAESGDEIYCNAILSEDIAHKLKRIVRQNKGKVAVGGALLGTIANGAYTTKNIIGNIKDWDDDRLDNETVVKKLLGNAAAGTGRQIGLFGLGAYGVGTGTKSYINKFRDRPKSVIAKKIASLRKIYSKWLQKANNAVEDREAGLAKRVAVKIMNLIDGLLNLLQKKADGR